jgi:hypothetical protein
MIVSRAHRLGEPVIVALGSPPPEGGIVREPDEAGPELALMAAAYGWTPDTIEALTAPQLAYYLRWLPLLEARRAYPIASLEAAVLNLVGGKRDDVEDAEASTPPPARHRLFTGEERLPPWAALEVGRSPWARASAIEALNRASELPTWALELLDFYRLRQVASSSADGPAGGTVLVAARTPAGDYVMMDQDAGRDVAILTLPEDLGDLPSSRAHPRDAVAIAEIR